MRTFRLLLVTAVVAMVATNIMAQENQKKKQRKGARLHPMVQAVMRFEMIEAAVKKIDLTEQQQSKLSSARESIQPKMAELLKKVAGILGDEKMKELSDVAKKAKEAGKTPRQVAVAVNAAMKLSDEQAEKMAKLAEDVKTAQRELVKKMNGMLTDEQKEKFKAEMMPGRGKKQKNK